MNIQSKAKLATIVLLFAQLVACGGGGGGATIAPPPPPPPPPPPSGGIEGSGISFGIISGFGSVIVNGVRFDTSAATITVDGVASTQADLAVGDVVLIDGTVAAAGDTGNAETIVQDHVVEGPIASIGTNAFVVLGQTVRVDDATLFDDDIVPASLAGLTVGAFVEVSGLAAASGAILATRVERDGSATELELTGIVASLDVAASRLVINGQGVNFSAAVLEDFPAGGIAAGDLVEVKADIQDGNGDLIATRVELKDDDFNVDFDDGDDLDVEGIITRFVSASDFDVAGFPVTTTAQTQFERGSAADLALDVRVEAEGSFNAGGVLVADKIEFRTNASLRIEARVDSVAADSLVLLGVTVTVNPLTQFDDSSGAELETFSLADINAGDFVEIRGSTLPGTSADVLAVRIKRDDDGDTKIRGPVESVAQPSLTILGVTIDTDGSTDFEDLDDMPLTATEFFGQVTVGTLVSAKGTEVSTSGVLASEVEFED